MRSSSTEPKNRQVLPGPVGFWVQGVEIEFVVSLLEPRRGAGMCSESQPECHDIARGKLNEAHDSVKRVPVNCNRLGTRARGDGEVWEGDDHPKISF